MNIVFWQNIISPHQVHYLVQLGVLRPDFTYSLVVNKEMSKQRKNLGWSVENIQESLQLIVSPDQNKIDELLSQKNTIHIISGINTSGLSINPILKRGIRLSAKMGLIVEKPDFLKLKGQLRKRMSIFLERRYAKYFDFVLAMGDMGVEWYSRFPFKKVFNFCYVVDHNRFSNIPVSNNKKVSFLYIGQLIHRKGIDLMLEAFKGQDRNMFQLSIVGKGDELNHLKRMVEELNLDENVKFLGVIPNSKLSIPMQASDCLILPSRHDGWGAVVNESLAAGRKVIVSNKCGASCLINDCNGEIFDLNNHGTFKNAISKVINEGPVSLSLNEKIKKQASSIDGSSIANYLLNILDYVYSDDKQPKIPWN